MGELEQALTLAQAALNGGHPDEVKRHVRRALNLDPHHPQARAMQAAIAWREGDISLTFELIQKALVRGSDSLEVRRMAARTYAEVGEWDKALEHYVAACELRPGVKTEMDIALCMLQAGRYAVGWALHERRVEKQLRTTKHLGAYLQKTWRPPWDGSPDRAVLLHYEQGYGDFMMFLRYVPEVVACSKRVMLRVPKAMERLTRMSVGGHKVLLSVDGPEFGNFDCWALMMSLPHLLGREGDFRPAPYLKAHAAGPEARPQTTRPQIGVVWGGSPNNPRDKLRSLTEDELLSMLSTDAVEWHVLQQGPHLNGMPRLRQRLGPQTVLTEYESAGWDWADTAYLAAQLDGVVTVDTGVAHLCGGLGLRTWCLVSTTPDFRYPYGADVSPWYPSMRLLRQPAPGRWDKVLHQVEEELCKI
jgi:hypothetical protein